jgi:ubiquinone/menaquinone biosynthesis C-methylase UbiE
MIQFGKTMIRLNHLFATLAVSLATISSNLFADTASDLLSEAEFSGGIILHIGSDDGSLSNALLQGENSLVYGLEKSGDKIKLARQRAYEQGISGKVTYSEWNGEDLPFAQNFINLIVCDAEVDEG